MLSTQLVSFYGLLLGFRVSALVFRVWGHFGDTLGTHWEHIGGALGTH